jgi:hypothetical protein
VIFFEAGCFLTDANRHLGELRGFTYRCGDVFNEGLTT